MLEQGLLRAEHEEPELGPFRYYYDAYRELSSCRAVGMALGPIPFTAVLEYSRLYDIGDFEEFLFLVRRMDNTFLSLVNKVDEPRKAPTNGK